MKMSHPQNATPNDLVSLFTDEETLKDREVIRLTAADSRAFVDELLSDSEPNEKLKRAAEDYLHWVSRISRE